jgi:hypothetical protein
VLYGSASGITAGYEFWGQQTLGIADELEENDFFGFSLAVGDFQNDGYADLVVGVPYEDRNFTDQGAVHVIPGSASGLTATGSQFWTEDSPGIDGTGEPGDHFGWSLAAGQFGYDAADDLAIGVPFEDIKFQGVGAVNVIYGSVGVGLTSTNDSQITEEAIGWGETADELFGWALAAGDMTGDGFDELLIGCPYENGYPNIMDSGVVFRLSGSSDGLPGLSWGAFHQDSIGIHGAPEAGDHFGYSVAVTEGKSINGDNHADVIVGIPGEEGSANDCGYIAVVRGDVGGWTPTGNQFVSEDTGGIPGSSELNDQWGVAVGGR